MWFYKVLSFTVSSIFNLFQTQVLKCAFFFANSFIVLLCHIISSLIICSPVSLFLSIVISLDSIIL